MKSLKVGKKSTVVLLLALTLAGFVFGAQTWVLYGLAPGEAAFAFLAVSGTEGLTPMMPILVALLAIAAVLMIVRRVVRIILGVLVALLGGWLSVKSFEVVGAGTQQLLGFGSQKLSELTGIVVTDAGGVVVDMSESVWPLAAGILGVAIVLLGLFIVFTSHTWVAGGRKYETKKAEAAPAATGDRIDDWDALSDGLDPSEN